MIYMAVPQQHRRVANGYDEANRGTRTTEKGALAEKIFELPSRKCVQDHRSIRWDIVPCYASTTESLFWVNCVTAARNLFSRQNVFQMCSDSITNP